ncbi:MAG: 50S ribosomal protein L11 methyltransferase [Candidatus Paceibacterota bacterium]
MGDKAFSSIDLVGQCLIDSKRTKIFGDAVRSIVKSHHTVLDAGTGSGIMALFAARAGAKRVFAIEYDHYVAEIAKKTFTENNFSKKIKLLIGNAKNFIYPKNVHFDVVIMEMLTTGMVDEFQIQAINNLHNRKAVKANTIFIPKAQKTYISLANTDFNLYGFKIKMVQHLWEGFPGNDRCKIVSEKELLHEISFNSPSNEFFNHIIDFKAEKNAIVNSIFLSSITILTDKLQISDTLSLNGPVVFPIESFKAKKSQSIKLRISYKFGGGFKNLTVKLLK